MEYKYYDYGIYNKTTKDKVSMSRKCIRSILGKYKTEELAISFSGGKDNIVMLYIILDELKKLNKSCPLLFMVNEKSQFKEMEEYISFILKKHNLYCLKYNNISIKEALNKLGSDRPSIKAIFMGTRFIDIQKYKTNKSSYFEYTDIDKKWPLYLRIRPIIYWSYEEIWSYILENNIKYCSLYDKGYTSIGNTENTLPNPKLQIFDPITGITKYQSAYMLKDEINERDGRI